MNLPLLTSVLSIACILTVGQRKWWGHLIGVANCVVFMVIAMQPGQWGYIPSNAVCAMLYLNNAVKWSRDAKTTIGKTAKQRAFAEQSG